MRLDLGFETGALVPTSAEALLWLDGNTQQVAILDFILRDGPCTALARAVKKKGVPFLIYSGVQRDAEHGSEYEGVQWVEKPASLTDALRVLTAAALSKGTAPAPSRKSASPHKGTSAMA